MASKAGKLKQKAFSVVDNVPLLSSHNPSNSCTITVKVRESYPVAGGRWGDTLKGVPRVWREDE